MDGQDRCGEHFEPRDPGLANDYSASDLTRFGAVDAAEEPDYYLRFLDTLNALPSFRALKKAMIDGMQLRPGQRALDVGCGTGGDVLRLAEVVGGNGLAVGVDNSEAMIAEARRRAKARGLTAEFRTADALALGFPDATFDATRIERTLVHIADPEAAIGEMARVTRPEGRVVSFDVDFDATVLDLPDVSLTRRAVMALSDSYTSGYIGRRLRSLFRTSGLEDVEVTPHVVCDLPYEVLVVVFSGVASEALGREEAERSQSHLREAHATGNLFCAIPGFIVSGRRA